MRSFDKDLLGTTYKATSCEELTHWKRLWCWEGLWAGGEGDNRGWDGWMASLTWWAWVWVNSGSKWWTGRPGKLRFMGSQRVGHNWVTELNWILSSLSPKLCSIFENQKPIITVKTNNLVITKVGHNGSEIFQRPSCREFLLLTGLVFYLGYLTCKVFFT